MVVQHPEEHVVSSWSLQHLLLSLPHSQPCYSLATAVSSLPELVEIQPA